MERDQGGPGYGNVIAEQQECRTGCQLQMRSVSCRAVPELGATPHERAATAPPNVPYVQVSFPELRLAMLTSSQGSFVAPPGSNTTVDLPAWSVGLH